MNLAKGYDNVLFRRTQGPKGNILFVSTDEARGRRFGLARRLLGAARGEDILAPDLARLLGKGGNAVYRWETGQDRPRSDALRDFVALCQDADLPITAGWLEHGESELPPIHIPPAALALKPPQQPVEAVPTTPTPLASTYEEQAAAAKKSARKRRSRGGG